MELLPPHWQGDTPAHVRDAAARMVRAREEGQKKEKARTPRWAYLLTLLLVVGGVGILLDGREAGAKSTVSYARGTVISTESTGTGVRPRDFVRAASAEATPAPTPSPSAAPAEAPADRAPKPPKRRASGPHERSRAAAPAWPADAEKAELELLLDQDPPAASPAPTAPPVPIVLNVGTRFQAVISHAVTTGASPVVVSASVAADVVKDGRVVIPAGAPLEGEAFATREDDRVRVLFHSVVVGGKTIGLRGLALAAEGVEGLAGKVLDKGKGRGAAGRLLGSAARVASYGLIGGGDTFAEDIAVDVAREAARDLGSLERRWTRSDKVIRLPAGTTAQVYLAGDVRVP
jgi:hypothetical protein